MKENYPLFVHWFNTLDWILGVVESFPKNARFSVASRIGDLALDTLEMIIEAIYTKDRVPILDRINLALEKQRVLFRLAHQRRYIGCFSRKLICRAST